MFEGSRPVRARLFREYMGVRELAPAGSTFNIVDQPLRYRDYVDALSDGIGAARPRRAPELPLPPSWRYANEAARTVLGWMPRGRLSRKVGRGSTMRAYRVEWTKRPLSEERI